MASLVGTKGVSESALSEILKQFQEGGFLNQVFGGVSRRQISRDMDGYFVGEHTVYGKLSKPIAFQTTGGETFDWAAVCPFACVNVIAVKVPAFGAMLKEQIRRFSKHADTQVGCRLLRRRGHRWELVTR